METQTDRIEKTTVLRAPLARVWDALTDARKFGTWFGIQFDGEFEPGACLNGRIIPTQVDAKVAQMQCNHTGTVIEFVIEQVEPMRLFSYRWHPFAIDRDVDYSVEPSTLVTFELDEVDGGTRLTVVESGFDRIPVERRADAFSANDEGWMVQLRLIEAYLERNGG